MEALLAVFILHLCRSNWALILLAGLIVTAIGLGTVAVTIGGGAEMFRGSEMGQPAVESALASESAGLLGSPRSLLQVTLLLCASMGASVVLAVALRSEPGQLIR